ncbi:hypothetical protein EJ07DRAFT_161501 [Lizonia empirigonia]|nr:hypothetical protein EJ07DRAFT_161501 [Lizonia empirigonia]
MASSPSSSTDPSATSDYTYTPPASSRTPPPLPGSPNISVREYIYFLPHPLPPGTPIPYTPGLPTTNPLHLPPHPFEPTSTLVLTSPLRTFVDLRYTLPLTPTSPLPNAGDPSRLDWGFAGTSSTTPAPKPHPRYGPFTGVAWHPRLGRVAGHEEMWVDVEARRTGRGAKVCVVLRAEDEARGVRGVVVRVGQCVQGIVGVGGSVATERWVWGGGSDGVSQSDGDGQSDDVSQSDGDIQTQTQTQTNTPHPQWTRIARTGDAFLPCAVTFRPEIVQVGGCIGYGGIEWVVEEAWEWV